MIFGPHAIATFKGDEDELFNLLSLGRFNPCSFSEKRHGLMEAEHIHSTEMIIEQ